MSRVTRHRWTPADDEIIERLVGDQRTITVLGLSRKVEGVYSANELSVVLGIEGNWIRSFLIGTGVLPPRAMVLAQPKRRRRVA